MQSYYKTLFYSNVYDTTTYVVLADQTEKIIEEEDIERGYVIKEQLLELYDYCIKANDIGTYSYLIEYIATTHDGVEKVETFRIKIM